jgi:DNA-binding transcriptional regulator YiaG
MMDKNLFSDLVESLKEAGAISRGEIPASRQFLIGDGDSLDVRGVREHAGLSQNEFANLMHVSVKTLQNWEQGRRVPTGAAVALLHVFKKAPDVVVKALNS